MKRLIGRILVAAAIGIGSILPVQAQEAPARLTLASGPVSGGWYPMAGVLSELIKSKYPDTDVTVTTGGGVENLPRVSANLAEIAFTQADIYAAGLEGTAPFESAYPGVSALGYLGYVPQAYFLVLENADYQSIEQIVADQAAIRLVLPPRNNGGELIVRRLLEQMDVDYEDIESWGGSIAFMGYAEASNLIGDGQADAYVGPVIGAIQELITQQRMRLLPWPEPVIDAILDQGYEKRVTPADQFYFVTEDTPMPALQNILIVREDLDADFVSGLAEILATHEAEIQQSAAMFQTYSSTSLDNVMGGPLHPGADAYYTAN